MVLLILKLKKNYRIINLNQVTSIDLSDEMELTFHEQGGDLIVYLDKTADKQKVWDKVFMALSHSYEPRSMHTHACRVELDLTQFVSEEAQF